MTKYRTESDLVCFQRYFERRGPNECWPWKGALARDRGGYGIFSVSGVPRRRRAHRWIYEQVHGPLPKHIYVCHHCDNPPCVNLRHLFIGTVADNVADMLRKGRWTRPPRTVPPKVRSFTRSVGCKNGHFYTTDNLRIDSRSRNVCLTCEMVRKERKRARDKERSR